MEKKDAIKNLKFLSWLFLIVGIIAIFSTIYYLGKIDISDSIFNFIFGGCMLAFSYIIHSSIKSLK